MSLHSPCLKTFSSSLQSGWSVNLAWPSGLYNAELNVSNVMFYGFWTKCNFCFIQSLLVPWAYHVHSLFVSLLSPNWFYLSFPLFLKNPLSTFQGPVQVHSLRPLPSSIPWLSQSMELSPSSFFFFGLRACGILVPQLWIKPMARIRGPCSGSTVLPTGLQGKSLSLLLISVVHTVCSIPIWHLAYIILLYAHLSIYISVATL